VTLLASLIIAYAINPVFAVSFMKPHVNESDPDVKRKKRRSLITITVILLVFAALFYMGGNMGMGNFIVFLWLLVLLNRFVLDRITGAFMHNVWPRVQNGYKRIITWALGGSRPVFLIIGTVFLFFFSIAWMVVAPANVETFPAGEPHFVYVYINMPV